jgi:hypothetical protein
MRFAPYVPHSLCSGWYPAASVLHWQRALIGGGQSAAKRGCIGYYYYVTYWSSPFFLS